MMEKSKEWVASMVVLVDMAVLVDIEKVTHSPGVDMEGWQEEIRVEQVGSEKPNSPRSTQG